MPKGQPSRLRDQVVLLSFPVVTRGGGAIYQLAYGHGAQGLMIRAMARFIGLLFKARFIV